MSAVNHPSHYNSGKFEVIEVIEDQRLGFHLGNAIKYICRAGKKLPEKSTKEMDRQIAVQDLEKAVWYIQRHIEILKPLELIRRPNEMNPRTGSAQPKAELLGDEYERC